MKWRTPKTEPRRDLEGERPRWESFEVTLITPMLGGGTKAGEPDEEMPVRASAIRGQLRYWWRFLNRGRFASREELFAQERRIWGGTGEEGEDFASKVRLRIDRWSGRRTFSYNDRKILPYALFPARGTRGEPAKKLIYEGLSFQLQIRCLDGVDFDRDVLPALRWWMTFGGLGARTRRGVGSVDIPDLDPVSPEEASEVGCRLVIRKRFQGDAMAAWREAVECLYKFRQGVGVARPPGPGRSNWPEPDTIRDITGRHAPTHRPNHPAPFSGYRSSSTSRTGAIPPIPRSTPTGMSGSPAP